MIKHVFLRLYKAESASEWKYRQRTCAYFAHKIGQNKKPKWKIFSQQLKIQTEKTKNSKIANFTNGEMKKKIDTCKSTKI